MASGNTALLLIEIVPDPAESMFTEAVRLSTAPLESEMVNRGEKLPLSSGVPLMRPADAPEVVTVRPADRAPPLRTTVHGLVPPNGRSQKEYGVPRFPFGELTGKSWFNGDTCSVYCLLIVTGGEELSVTLIVTG